jgi:ADP-glucose pyrophosphorylase
VENSILWDGATIGSDATVQNSIIGKEVVVENGAKVMDNSLSSTS